MAGTVAQYQQGAFITPVNETTADASVVLSNDNTLRAKYNSHDADPTIHLQSSVLASRPAAGTASRVWITTDGKRLYLDSGSAWDEVDYLSKTAGGTVAGAVTLSASLTAAAASFSGAVTMASTVTLTANATYLTGRTAAAVDKRLIGVNASDKVVLDADGLGAIFAGSVTANGGVTVSAGGLTVSAGTTAVQALTATTAQFSGAVTATVAPFIAIASAAADFNKIYRASRGGLTRWALACDASDSFALLNAAETTANVTVTDSGAMTLRAGLTTGSGVTISAGGLTVSAGGIAVTGNSTITGALSGISTLTATTFVGALTGNASSATTAAACSGNAATATALQTARSINGTSFNGTADITVAAAAGTLTGATLAAGVTASSLTSVGVLAAPHMTSVVIDSGGLTITAGTLAASSSRVTSGNLEVWNTWDGSNAAGVLKLTSDVATTATAGAQTLPGAPAGFLAWKMGASTVKIPYYNS